MVRVFLLLCIGTFAALAPPVRAETFELREKRIRIHKKNADVFPEIELRGQGSIPGVGAEPRYRSDRPQRFHARFGPGDGITVGFAVDERGGPGKGFDLLYADVEGKGDLERAKRLGGKPRSRGASYEDTEFPSFDIRLPAGDSTRDYPVRARFSVRKIEPPDASLYLSALTCLEGEVQFGETKQEIVVFDANCNGVFGEKGRPGEGRAIQGDRIWIGARVASLESAYVEATPLGKYTLFEGEYYEIDFPAADRVEIAKAEVPLGRIKVSNPGFLLELVRQDGVLYVGNPDSDEIGIPVGSYRVYTPGFRRRYRGSVWELEGEPGGCDAKFEVAEGSVTEIAVGPPLRLVIVSALRPMGNGVIASFDFRIEGSEKERYRFLRKDGKKVELPEISIRDQANREVKSGQFEYG
jgi:hypothetical protein